MRMRTGRRSAVVVASLIAALGMLVAGPASVATASGARQPVLLGFGDSVAAGYGLMPPSTGEYSAACARSDASYVNKAADELHYGFVNYACSGAVTTNIFLESQATATVNVPVQLRQAASGPQPTYAVTTVGANDIRWSSFLVACLQAQPDCATDVNTQLFHDLLAKAKVGLVASLVGEELLRPRRIFVTGYYDPLAAFGGHPPASLTSEEIAWFQSLVTEVNVSIQHVAQLFPNATFVPVDLKGPGLVQPPGAPGAFHPTDTGQQVIAGDLIAAIRAIRAAA